MIEDDYIVLNLGENNPFVLIFSKEVEEKNNNSDIDIDNSFIEVSAIFPLPLKYRKYINIFSKSEVR